MSWCARHSSAFQVYISERRLFSSALTVCGITSGCFGISYFSFPFLSLCCTFSGLSLDNHWTLAIKFSSNIVFPRQTS